MKSRNLSGRVTRIPQSRCQAAIASVLESEILEAAWAPGTRLPGEAELCARFGASRSALREALQVLKTRGLVESRRGSGSYVPANRGAACVRDTLTLYSKLMRDAPAFLELFDLRLLVETFCVRHLAAAAPDRHLDRLENCLLRMEGSMNDLGKFAKEDIAFHLTLVKETKHELFSNIMRGVLPGLGVRFALETYTSPSLIKRNLADHRAILRHLTRGHGDEAEERLRDHLMRSRQHLESMLKNPPNPRCRNPSTGPGYQP